MRDSRIHSSKRHWPIVASNIRLRVCCIAFVRNGGQRELGVGTDATGGRVVMLSYLSVMRGLFRTA